MITGGEFKNKAIEMLQRKIIRQLSSYNSPSLPKRKMIYATDSNNLVDNNINNIATGHNIAPANLIQNQRYDRMNYTGDGYIQPLKHVYFYYLNNILLLNNNNNNNNKGLAVEKTRYFLWI